MSGISQIGKTSYQSLMLKNFLVLIRKVFGDSCRVEKNRRFGSCPYALIAFSSPMALILMSCRSFDII